MACVNDFRDFLIGADPMQVEHIWQSMYIHSFYRAGPVIGSAISGIDQEGDLLWSGRVERRHAGDATARVALERRAEGLGKLPEREPGGRSHQGVFFAGACWSYARMISSVRSASGDAYRTEAPRFSTIM